MNYHEALLELRKFKLSTDERGLSYKIKNVPETKELKIIDPRLEKTVMDSLNEPDFIIRDQKNPTLTELLAIRKLFAKKNKDLSSGILTEKMEIEGIPIELYRKEDSTKKSPCVFYIHGGGFIAGGIDTVRNPCKLICDRSESIVISIDYSLAPEHPFPSAINQCFSIIKYFANTCEEYNIDRDKLIIMGDSAGGNIAAACCLLDKKQYIKLQVLLYPLVDINPIDNIWNKDYYGHSNNDMVSNILIHQVKDLMTFFAYSYLKNNEKYENELISPLYAKDCNRFPLTLLVSPEYDYLRVQDEEFAHNLEENGVDIIVLRYQGMAHAFLEALGEYPQAEDCINEIAQAIRDC